MRRGGRHSEKLLTLTLPHLPEHGVRQRIELVKSAWPYFLKSLNAYLRERGESAEWLRSVEWTLGSDEQGHPHMHVWFFGPWLPHKPEDDQVTAWWRKALVHVGFPRNRLDALMVDLRAVRSGRVDEGGDIVTEVVKYMTKDIVAPGEHVAPETYAKVYEAFDGRRTLQASRGFMALADKPVCCRECGAEASLRVQVAKRPDWAKETVSEDCARVDVATGPPGTWREEVEASLLARKEARAKCADGPAHECAVCTVMNVDLRRAEKQETEAFKVRLKRRMACAATDDDRRRVKKEETKAFKARPKRWLKRRVLDGRTVVTLCSRCASHVGPRHATLAQLARDVASSVCHEMETVTVESERGRAL